MATRRREVSRSIITTRSSSSKTTKHKSGRHAHQHQELPTTTPTRQEASSTKTTITTTTYQNQPCSPSPIQKEKHSSKAEDEDVEGCDCNWSTPKAKRFRIPEIENCPPAPKKLRTINNIGGSNCSSLRRSSIPFFTPPELTEFFFRVSGVSNMYTAA